MDDGIGAPFSERDLEQLFEISGTALCLVDLDGKFLRVSSSMTQLLGWASKDMLGHQFLEFVHPGDQAVTCAQFVDHLDGDAETTSSLGRYVKADGGYRWLRWDSRVDRAGGFIWGMAHDVTEQHNRSEQQQMVAELGRKALEGVTLPNLLQSAVEGLAHALAVPIVAVLELRPDRHLQVRKGTGIPHDEADPVLLPVDDTTLSGTALLTGSSVTSTDVDTGQGSHPLQQQYQAHGAIAVPIGRRDEPWGVFSCADVRPRAFDSAEVRFLEQVAHVVSAAIDRNEQQERLLHQATHDGLTGLPNRELLRERMNATLHEPGAGGLAVGLLLCDLDGFKDVNDSLGHAAGDAVLRQVAQRLLETVGEDDTVARLGGDEFAIFVTSAPTEIELLGVADSVVTAMRRPFSLPEFEVRLSTSIGVVVSPTHGFDASTLLRHADVAMYRAKAGSLGWSLYDPSVDGAKADRLAFTADLRGAIATGALQVHYQPVVDLQTGQLHSVEALCRWDHIDRGEVTPTVFIPLAEETGTVLALTSWVVRQAADQVRAWRAAGHDLRCAVNLSMAAVTDDRTSDSLVDELIAAAPLLTVEVTESWLVDARGQEVIAKLARGGVQLAIDDFGTGFSSLASLRSFPVRQLKLDQQFMRDPDDARGQDVVLAVVQLGQALGMEIVAEGIEDQRTADRLQTAGVRLGQGFLWAPALPAKDLEGWLGDHTIVLTPPSSPDQMVGPQLAAVRPPGPVASG